MKKLYVDDVRVFFFAKKTLVLRKYIKNWRQPKLKLDENLFNNNASLNEKKHLMTLSTIKYTWIEKMIFMLLKLIFSFIYLKILFIFR